MFKGYRKSRRVFPRELRPTAMSGRRGRDNSAQEYIWEILDVPDIVQYASCMNLVKRSGNLKTQGAVILICKTTKMSFWGVSLPRDPAFN